jgi:hypothetical protein
MPLPAEGRYPAVVPKPPDAASRALEASIDALYRLPLDRFTPERNALAASLKKAGDKAAAERVKSLAKPSATAWAVNQAWWTDRDRFQAMLDAGAAQRKAHLAFAEGRNADVRAAGEVRREAVARVSGAALDALGGKQAVAPDVQYRIAGTLEALASSGVPEGESPGRLTRDLQSSGLDALTALAEAAAASPRPTIVARGTPPAPKEADRRGRDRFEAPPATTARTRGHEADAVGEGTERARDRKAREAADAAARTRAAEVAAAEARVDELSTALGAADRAVEQASRLEAEARRALDAATARRKELEAALDQGRAAEAAARRDLSGATAAASRAEMDRGRAARDVARAREALDRVKR